jgi:hypothetical protein
VRLARVLLVAAAALAAAAAVPAERGSGAASRVIDRTFRCTPASLAPGLRELDVLAIPIGERWTGSPQENPSPGYISLNSGGWKLGSELVAVRARPWQRFAVSSAPGVYAQASCRPVSRSLPLSPKGLAGPPTRWRDSVSCTLSGRAARQPDAFRRGQKRGRSEGRGQGREASPPARATRARLAGPDQALDLARLLVVPRTTAYYRQSARQLAAVNSRAFPDSNTAANASGLPDRVRIAR